MYGGVDFASGGGALLPADPDCNKDVRAKSLRQALGHDESTHGSWGLDLDPVDLLDGKFGVQNPCGDVIRQLVISALQSVLLANNPSSNASGDPGFADWPVWNDVTHQAMYIDWIQRAHEHGLSVMVAFTVNNETLADTVAGPGDSPDDDKASSDLQIAEIKKLASRHSDWMEVAYNSDDLARIVSAGKLALILGLEVDNIGDFNRKAGLTIDDVKAEIARLYNEGVRYLFPVHLIDNPFGTTAAYQDIFNLSNLREAGHFWNLVCANAGDNVSYRYALGNPLTETLDLDPPSILTAELAAAMVAKLGMLGDTYDPPIVPSCPAGIGMVNSLGLTELGKAAIQEMMRQGMILDVDHMSQASVNDALSIAEAQRYPVNSGHNAVRRGAGTERALTAAQYARIGRLHGMAGVGSAQTSDSDWLALYQDVAASLGRTDGIGFGTDASGLSPLMPAYSGQPERSFRPHPSARSGHPSADRSNATSPSRRSEATHG
jgi:microsomal dipeptidase-like Zn-dependent dipeptidase